MQAGLRQFSASLRSELIYEKRPGGKSSVMYFFSSQLIILTSLKDESGKTGKILKGLLALSSLELGI